MANTPYLTFTSASNFSVGYTGNSSAPTLYLEYSLDLETWVTMIKGSAVSVAGGNNFYMRSITGHTNRFSKSNAYHNSLKLTGSNISVSGNIVSLIDSSDCDTRTTISSYSLARVFEDCTALTDASGLTMPVTEVQEAGCRLMFSNTRITMLPANFLSATNLNDSCYNKMFKGCTSLITAPRLPATTLAPYCYGDMFYGCTSLIDPPELPATTLADSCYSSMFCGCTALGSVPELPATTLASYCYYQMFYGCTALTNLPNNLLPAVSTDSYCYYSMFNNCGSLINTPKLLITESVANYSFSKMFANCGSLVLTNFLKIYSTAWFYANCLTSMFENCTNVKIAESADDTYQIPIRIPISGTRAQTTAFTDMFTGTGGTFTGTPTINTTYYLAGIYGIKLSSEDNFTLAKSVTGTVTATLQYSTDGTTWSTLEDSIVVSPVESSGTYSIYVRGSDNTTLSIDANNYINLVITPASSNTIKLSGNILSLLNNSAPRPDLTSHCFLKLFANNTAIADISELELPSETLADNCYNSMFYGCTGLSSVTELPATTLSTSCYANMFASCTSLTADLLPELPATTLANTCYSNMFNGCTGIELSATKSGTSTKPYTIPSSGTATAGTDSLLDMFANTSGSFTGTPEVNTSYYAYQEYSVTLDGYALQPIKVGDKEYTIDKIIVKDGDTELIYPVK